MKEKSAYSPRFFCKLLILLAPSSAAFMNQNEAKWALSFALNAHTKSLEPLHAFLTSHQPPNDYVPNPDR